MNSRLQCRSSWEEDSTSETDRFAAEFWAVRRWMVWAIPSSLDFTKCRYFTSTVYPTSSTFLCGCTAPFIRMKSRRVVVEHVAKKASKHNIIAHDKLLGILLTANQYYCVHSWTLQSSTVRTPSIFTSVQLSQSSNLEISPSVPIRTPPSTHPGCLICCNKPSHPTSCAHMLTE